jgi:hypothetical protein
MLAPPLRAAGRLAMSIFRLLRISKGMKFPAGDRLYYRCAVCGDVILSIPEASTACTCGNLSIDLETSTLREKKKGTVRLMRRIA